MAAGIKHDYIKLETLNALASRIIVCVCVCESGNADTEEGRGLQAQGEAI